MTKVSKKSQNKQSCKTGVSGSRFVPMLFSTPMVQAILNKTKTETRISANNNYHLFTNVNEPKGINYTESTESIESKIKINDIIWVRETFSNGCIENGKNTGFRYKADDESFNVKWKPSLFMPKDACRIFLKCVSVHVERLQDIDEQSAMNEGIMKQKTMIKDCNGNSVYIYGATHYAMNGAWSGCHKSAISAFRSLWYEINGFESWNKNPFVWVYKFERIERPHDFH